MVGPLAAQQMLRLTLALKTQHPEEEDELIQRLHDPDSPDFHQYLSAGEWNARFAPSEQDEQAVVDWARSQGLTITHRFANRLLVDVEAPVSVIERAFDVSLDTYQMDGKAYYSNDRDPSIPSSLSNVIQFVFGLNNFNAMHRVSPQIGQRSEPDSPIYSAGPVYAVAGTLQREGDPDKATNHHASRLAPMGGPYAPPDLYSSYAYNYSPLQGLGHCCNPLNNPNISPPEASIAVAIWGDYADSDIQTWVSQYGLALHATRILLDGAVRCGAPPKPQCDAEATVDLEYTTAMANSFRTPGTTAAVYEYEGANGNSMPDVLNHILSDLKVRVVNMSWGIGEDQLSHTELNSWNTLLKSMVTQGFTLVAASGDGGSTADCASVTTLFPASDPYVVAVGGTSLNTSSGGFLGETAWQGNTAPGSCDNNDGGSGGGCSGYFGAPYYQPGACNNKRSVPDISLNADFDNAPQLFWFLGSWYWVGGTSIASPEVAGFFAQENAYLIYIQSIVGNTCGSSHNSACVPLGWGNPYIYNEAVHHPAPHYPFYDVTSGCNSNDVTHSHHLAYYCAARGYDQVTGWGSANMFQFAWSINYQLAGDNEGPSISISGPPVNQWYTFDQTINWTMTDQSAGGHQANGVSGYSLGWDGDPGDPYSQPTPGGGNNYYGLQGYGSSGSGSGLANLPQGCHTAYVRGWDNGGNSSLGSYGPLCFDNIAPVTQINLSGNFQGGGYVGPVQVSLSPTDNASGVAATYYSVDFADFQPYTGAFYVYLPQQQHCVQAYSVDVAGNREGNEINCFTIISNTQAALTISKAGTGNGLVTSSDGGINCGPTCSSLYWDGQPVTLTASPSGQSLLTGWRNCDTNNGFTCTLTMTIARTVTVAFNNPVALQFVPVPPCRVVDTRGSNGPFGGPAIAGGTWRNFAIPQGPCSGIPSNTAAYSLNVTVVPQGRLNYLSAWPAGYTRPSTSLMNSGDGRTKANATIVPAGDSSAVSVFVTDTANVILDIDGYFVNPAGNTLAFFPLAPCRIVDTRGANGPLGGPILSDRQPREFPILQATACAIPANAVAYSFNVTALPQNGQSLGYLTVWPSGEAQPVVSTLNAPTGVNTANAAIVPAGTSGDISVYPYGNNTNLLIDINGYFAPPASNPAPLALYTFNPCRVLDTRSNGGAFTGQKQINVASSPCEVSLNAKTYSMNATVVPSGGLTYLTLWPDNSPQPGVSTLNAPDGAVTSNLAIVPTSNGSIDAFASQATQLILDISSYFAP